MKTAKLKIEDSKMPRILVVLGPTASGKSDLAVSLAKKYNGEVISADSRQVYKGLDIGTGKITKKEMRGIRHHLLDVASPSKRFTVSRYQQLAYKAINDVLTRDKLPIICGGTGFYIQSIVEGLVLPDIDPDLKLRSRLEKLSTDDLFIHLKKIDPIKAKNIDSKNRPRLIRAIEIARTSGKNYKLIKKPKYDPLQIGIRLNNEILKARIEDRLLKRLKEGMIREIERLHKKGLSWKKLEELGLEYRYIALYLQDKISKEEMTDKLKIKILQYAKKQMTWFKRDTSIHWLEI